MLMLMWGHCRLAQMGGVRVFSGQDVNTFEAREYDQAALARYLGIQPGDLPVLAALTGNDMGAGRNDDKLA